MDLTQALKSLALDQWYKLLVWIGGVATLGSLFLPVKAFSNSSILPLFGGLFLLGLGEWASRRREPYERETRHGSTVRGWEMRRFNNIPGNSMSIAGAVLVIYGVYSIVTA